MASVWRNRDFTVLWCGRMVSAVGSGISAIGLPLLVLATTGSPARAGVVSAASGVPYFVLALPAGVAVDRWPRRSVLIGCDAGRGLVWAAVGVAVLAHRTPLLFLAAMAATEGTFLVFHNLAMTAALPRVVPPELLGPAVAHTGLIPSSADLLGPALGGAIFQAGHSLPFLVDAVSYSASIAGVAVLRSPLGPEERVSTTVRRDLADGWRFLVGHAALRTLALVGGLGDLLFAGVGLVLIVTAQRRAHASPAAIGLVFAVASGAAVAGAVVAARVVGRLGPMRTFRAFIVMGAIVFPGLVAARSVAAIAVVWAANIVVLTVANTGRETFQLSAIPDDLQGRVNGLVDFAAYGSLPIGTAAAGFVLAGIGPVRALEIMAIGRAALTAWTLASPAVRRAAVQQ